MNIFLWSITMTTLLNILECKNIILFLFKSPTDIFPVQFAWPVSVCLHQCWGQITGNRPQRNYIFIYLFILIINTKCWPTPHLRVNVTWTQPWCDVCTSSVEASCWWVGRETWSLLGCSETKLHPSFWHLFSSGGSRVAWKEKEDTQCDTISPPCMIDSDHNHRRRVLHLSSPSPPVCPFILSAWASSRWPTTCVRICNLKHLYSW